MFRFLFTLCVIASVSAFIAPNVRSTRSAAVSMAVGDDTMSKSIPFLKKPKNLDGLIGNEEFDPIGFAEMYDIKWMAEAELKHCRVAMLAVVGWLVQVLTSDKYVEQCANTPLLLVTRYSSSKS
jgi:hypothetical protein